MLITYYKSIYWADYAGPADSRIVGRETGFGSGIWQRNLAAEFGSGIWQRNLAGAPAHPLRKKKFDN
jgi:hypothetical protein